MNVLPKFKGYTVDIPLRQFRIVKGMKIEFIDFDSELGDKLLCAYVDSLEICSEEFEEVKSAF